MSAVYTRALPEAISTWCHKILGPPGPSLPVLWGPHRKPGAPFQRLLYTPSAFVNACHSSVKGVEASMYHGQY